MIWGSLANSDPGTTQPVANAGPSCSGMIEFLKKSFRVRSRFGFRVRVEFSVRVRERVRVCWDNLG